MTEETPSKGLGDSVEKIIHKVGDGLKIEFIRNKKGCEGCRRRKEMLNNLVPYNNTKKPCNECNQKKKKKKGGCRNCGDK